MKDEVKKYADTLYERSLYESAGFLRDARSKFGLEMAARRRVTALPLSGFEIQALMKLFGQHVERCMEARLESYRTAYNEAKQYPTDDELRKLSRL